MRLVELTSPKMVDVDGGRWAVDALGHRDAFLEVSVFFIFFFRL